MKLFDQIKKRKTVEQQVNMLWRLVNIMKVQFTVIKTTHKETKRNLTLIKKDLRAMKAKKAREKAQKRDATRQESRQRTSSQKTLRRETSSRRREREREFTSTLSIDKDDTRRSTKFPDSLILTDGVNSTFKMWSVQLQNKFVENYDWFEKNDPIREEQAKIAYVKNRVKEKAFEHLYPFLKAKEEEGENLILEDVITYLENVFEDSAKRLKARREMKNLKMSYLEDFNDFHSEFLRLTALTKISRDMWKEEIHDKLYSSLKIIMRDLAGRDDVEFDQYCKKAQNFAREHSDAGKERFERRATVTAKSMKTSSTLKIKTTEVIKGTEATRFTRSVTSRGDAVQKCYRCGMLRSNLP